MFPTGIRTDTFSVGAVIMLTAGKKSCVSGLFCFRAELNFTNYYYTEHLFDCQVVFWRILKEILRCK